MAHTFGIECTHGSWYHLHQNREKTDSHGSLMVFFAICLYMVYSLSTPSPLGSLQQPHCDFAVDFFIYKNYSKGGGLVIWRPCFLYSILFFWEVWSPKSNTTFVNFLSLWCCYLVVQQNKSFICSSNIGVSTEWVVHTKQQALLFVTNFIQFQ